MLLLDNLKAACSAAKAGRKVMPVKEIPTVEIDVWGWTMEACLSFSRPTREAVIATFHMLLPEVQKMLTNAPKSGEWVPRAKLWKALLQVLPFEQRNEAMLKILDWYVTCVRRRNAGAVPFVEKAVSA